ncbi:biotin-dependent carboxyltransferase family protein [Liquorilactobacillus uvarum]|uniref:Carboxyltransferase domain-containing protein n=1 Tax=Liquorilactobacillus uvarum DSM 19971 TaxID=1423812 RepID=A0A0R1PNF1_9LACO|nr:biotin-dependent carboxyltransferase family protein [Liquorilactobacillus uvarum]KRL33708.1 hypothetical protein FD20_GL001825 [Liquorilactobacillus uvarum DSM 19971]
MKIVEVLEAGLVTTIQDLGRPGYQGDGVPVSGAVDTMAHRMANILVGNDKEAATLEFCMLGPKLKFACKTFIAVTGGASQPLIDGKPIFLNKVYSVKSGSVLSFKPMTSDRYGYIAVANGGFLIKPLLNSRATTVRLKLGGFKGRCVREGDHLPIAECFRMPSFQYREFSHDKKSESEKNSEIRFIKGPQWDLFTSEAQMQFCRSFFTISQQADRMGYRLDGEKMSVPESNMLSEGTVLGNIQITRDGRPIVLLADRQTTGGYPVIATIIAADLSKFVQLSSRQQIHFQPVSLDKASSALVAQNSELKKFKLFLETKRYQYPIGPIRKAAQKLEILLDGNG